MKRRIFMLLVAMMMVLGMSFTSMADEVKYYDVTGNIYVSINENFGRYDIISGSMECGSDYRMLEFSTIEGEHTLFIKLVESPWGGEPAWHYAEFDGEYYLNGETYDPLPTVGGEIVGLKIAGSNGDGKSYALALDGLVFTEVDDRLYEVSTGFTGAAVSDRGDYNLYIAGYFKKDLTNGTHVLALSDITSQTIAIVAHNNANEINRNMNQSTIEEMTVTISGGVMTEMTIRGRVQTDGGTLDRYTTIINP